MMFTTILVWTLLAAFPSQPKSIGLQAMPFTLQDQFENEWKWENHWKGKPVVLVLSDWKGSDYTTAWTDPLTQRFKDKVQFVAVADVSLAPSFVHGLIRSRFRDAYSYSILLDWEGDVCRYYKMQEGLPNVLFIDGSGQVRLHTWGKGSKDHVETFATQLERML